MKKMILVASLLLLQACASTGASRNERLFNFFEIYNGKCQYAYAIDKEITDICANRFVHAQTKRGIYFFVYYFEGNVQIVLAGEHEVSKDDNIYLNVESVSIIAKDEDSKEVPATGRCGIVNKENKQYSVCRVKANDKIMDFKFLITDRAQ